jgi:hypothetical protein
VTGRTPVNRTTTTRRRTALAADALAGAAEVTEPIVPPPDAHEGANGGANGDSAPPIVLPNLDYSCARCGVQIHHDSDPALVRAVAVHHNAVAHRRDQFHYGDLIIRWVDGFAPADVLDRLTNALFELLAGSGVDLWVDDMQAAFDYLPPERLEPCLELIAKFVGPNLEVIDRR